MLFSLTFYVACDQVPIEDDPIEEVVASGITITQPLKTVYTVGDEVDLSGLSVVVDMSDGSTLALDASQYTVSTFTTTEAGTITVTVTHLTFSKTFNVTIEPVPVVATGIEITPPSVTEYLTDDAIDWTGFSVVMKYSDGSEELLSESDFTVSGFDSLTAGVKTITVESGDFSTTFTVNVSIRVVAVGIEIKTMPTKLTYNIGNLPNYTGLVVERIFNTGTREIVPSNDYVITGFSTDVEGVKTVLITAGDFTAQFSITVRPPYVEIPDKEDLEAFETFIDALFIEFLEGDAFSVNYMLLDPSVYGLEDEEASLSRPSLADFNAMMASASAHKTTLLSFNYNDLSKRQKITYDCLLDSLEDTLAYEPFFYLSNSYLGSYLGYQAQLPIILAEYRFDDMQDIENYFSLVEDILPAFQTYFLFEQERSTLGYGMADFVIDKVIEQCENMISSTDVPYLVRIFNDKVNSLAFLSEIEKTELMQRNEQLVEDSFMAGYAYLATNLPDLKGMQPSVGGLFHLPNGAAYYEAKFRSATGIDIEIDQAFTYLENKAVYFLGQYQGLVGYAPNYRDYLKLKFTTLDALGMVEHHKAMMLEQFPALSNDPDYVLKMVDISMQDNFSPAAYFLSPIDAQVVETMYFNPKHMLNINYVYTTMAHEGYPGHLYQHVYFKSETDAPMLRHVLSYGGYDEGWASYVERLSVNWGDGSAGAKAIYLANSNLNAAVTAILDIGIHYYGWSVTEMGTYLNTKFGFNATGHQALYDQLVEIPTNVQKYYYTYFTILDYKKAVSDELGPDLFSPIEFHTVLLDTGPAPFFVIKAELDAYVLRKILTS